MLSNFPIIKEKRPGYCLIASTYMVLKYWYVKGFLSRRFPTYEEFSGIFAHLVNYLGFPPNKLRDYIIKVEELKNVRVRHRTAGLSTLEYLISVGRPPIVLFDFLYYQQLAESKAEHATVLIGFGPENLYANDPIMGEKYPYEKKRFINAWSRKGNKYISIEPIRQLRLNNFKSGASGNL